MCQICVKRIFRFDQAVIDKNINFPEIVLKLTYLTAIFLQYLEKL